MKSVEQRNFGFAVLFLKNSKNISGKLRGFLKKKCKELTKFQRKTRIFCIKSP